MDSKPVHYNQRNLCTPGDWISFAQEVFRDFTARQYKSSLFYGSNYQISPFMIEHFIATKNISGLQQVNIGILPYVVNYALSVHYSETYRESIPAIALDAATLQITGHGECGMQSNGLIYYLMKLGVPNIARMTIDISREDKSNTHGLVLMTNEDENIYIIFDPFLNICCTYEEYFENPIVLQYGQKITLNPNWKPIPDLMITNYSEKDYKFTLTAMNTHLERLINFKNKTPIKETLEYLDYIVHLKQTNFDKNTIKSKTDYYFSIYESKFNPVEAQSKNTVQKTSSNPNNLFLPSPHNEFLAKMETLVNMKGRGKTLLTSIRDNKYASAARTACNDKEGYDFVLLMISYNSVIDFEWHKPGPSNLSALDYANKNADERIYNLLPPPPENMNAPK